MNTGYPLPADSRSYANQKAQGFATPKEDSLPQSATFLPKRVLPIVFLPGNMGTNLRLTPERQTLLGKEDNIAWRPDNLGAGNLSANANVEPPERQLTLDPLATEVDVYDPNGDSKVSGDARHGNVQFDTGYVSALIADDPPTAKNARTAAQKARLRGWSEVYFKSYGVLLQRLESRLNNTFANGKLQEHWRDVVGVDPATWGLHADHRAAAKPITEAELKQMATGCWFPVYAFGYNRLQDNRISAEGLAKRITKLIQSLTVSGFDCTQVVIVTHSMGGLVGRALVHPAIGGLQDKVAGIVHGVMPATGAAAGYKRILAGFEDPGLLTSEYEASGAAKVIGNLGEEVTAVLANSPGGLQLLPSTDYGNGWLRVSHRGRTLEAWPKNGDPYQEI